jgi:UDP-xylose/UDP-N-acetylglucosamine transporter B4
LVGLFFTSKFFTVKNNIPMKDYFRLVIMFFVSSVLNNYALNFNISVPLLMIFRSGSLMANMILGIIILNKSYDNWKYLSVILITLGIFICTIASGSDIKKSQGEREDSSFFWWLFGVFQMSLALFISARMGLYQEVMFKERGKHASEALFYTHLLPLPVFLLMSKNIWNHFEKALQSNVVEIPVVGESIRSQIAYLILNFVAHYICASSVYTLTAECTSLTVTMVVTLRKFASLLFSIVYFRHPFTFTHWLGTILIVIGTVMFTEIVAKT